MKKVIVSLASLVISLVLSGTARAQAHRNAYGGGSTYHSGNSTTRTNAYGGSATHTAGQGTTATNAYGGSASHAEGSGKTTATNAYGGSVFQIAHGTNHRMRWWQSSGVVPLPPWAVRNSTAGRGTTATNACSGSASHAEGSGKTTAAIGVGGGRLSRSFRMRRRATVCVGSVVVQRCELRYHRRHWCAWWNLEEVTATNACRRQLLHRRAGNHRHQRIRWLCISCGRIWNDDCHQCIWW